MSVRISRDVLEQQWGTEDNLMTAIDEFSAALAEHAETVGAPAPTAHPIVENIVRSGGAYEIAVSESPKAE